MKERIRIAGSFLLSLLLPGLAGAAAGPAARLQAGEIFPDLVLPSLDGRAPVSLRDFRGRKLVLHVFASW